MPRRQIRHVISTMDFRDDHLAQLHEATGAVTFETIDTADREALEVGLRQADTAFLKPDVSSEDLLRSNLKWVHLDIAGLNRFASPALVAGGLALTGSSGRSAPVLAEHALMFMLSLAFKTPEFLDAQRKKRWGIADQGGLQGLFSKTVGIIGVGNTGAALAARCKALEMRVIGFNRSHVEFQHVDKLYSIEKGDGLAPLLQQSDFIVLCVPLTNQTYRMIGHSELSLMKTTACLINISRGETVDEDALIEALHSGSIPGAGLDVFETEPLNKDSDLWSIPGVLITPHVTPQMPDRLGRSVKIILENISRFRNGQPLLNRLSPSDVFTGMPV
ncbi:MAG: D-2-hydroxyacid dehydrogenase [Stappiaceae bacterium]